MKQLKVVRSDGREVMATRVESIAAAVGALCERRLDHWARPGCISLRIAAPGGLTVNLSFGGDTGKQALHFLHWNMEADSRTRLHPGFGGVNAPHFCKATHVAYSFDALCEQLELSLRLAASGDAYQVTEKPVRQLAEAP